MSVDLRIVVLLYTITPTPLLLSVPWRIHASSYDYLIFLRDPPSPKEVFYSTSQRSSIFRPQNMLRFSLYGNVRMRQLFQSQT